MTTRQLLCADRSYYVPADGDDSNDGLSYDSGGAFLTLQKAVDVVRDTLDLGGHIVTVCVGAGTFDGVVASGPFVGSVGPVSVVFSAVEGFGNTIIDDAA